MSKKFVLYRAFDELGRLLYIGQTANPAVRLRKHAESKDWWSGVARIQLEHFRSRDDIDRAEQIAIGAERPVLNVQHNAHRDDQATVTPIVRYYDDGDPEDPYSEYFEPEDACESNYVIVEYDAEQRSA